MDPRSSPSRLFAERPQLQPKDRELKRAGISEGKKNPAQPVGLLVYTETTAQSRRTPPYLGAPAPRSSPAHPGRREPITAQLTASASPGAGSSCDAAPGALPRCCGGPGTPAQRCLPALARLSPKASVSSWVHLPGAVCAVVCVSIYLCTTCKFPPDSLHSIY